MKKEKVLRLAFSMLFFLCYFFVRQFPEVFYGETKGDFIVNGITVVMIAGIALLYWRFLENKLAEMSDFVLKLSFINSFIIAVFAFMNRIIENNILLQPRLFPVIDLFITLNGFLFILILFHSEIEQDGKKRYWCWIVIVLNAIAKSMMGVIVSCVFTLIEGMLIFYFDEKKNYKKNIIASAMCCGIIFIYWSLGSINQELMIGKKFFDSVTMKWAKAILINAHLFKSITMTTDISKMLEIVRVNNFFYHILFFYGWIGLMLYILIILLLCVFIISRTIKYVEKKEMKTISRYIYICISILLIVDIVLKQLLSTISFDDSLYHFYQDYGSWMFIFLIMGIIVIEKKDDLEIREINSHITLSYIMLILLILFLLITLPKAETYAVIKDGESDYFRDFSLLKNEMGVVDQILIVNSVPQYTEKFDFIKLDDVANGNRIIRVRKNNKWGLIDIISGKTIVSPQYEKMLPFMYDYAAVKEGERWYFINYDGEEKKFIKEEIISVNLLKNEINQYSKECIIKTKSGKYALFNLLTEKTKYFDFDTTIKHISICNGYIYALKPGKTILWIMNESQRYDLKKHYDIEAEVETLTIKNLNKSNQKVYYRETGKTHEFDIFTGKDCIIDNDNSIFEVQETGPKELQSEVAIYPKAVYGY